MNKKQRNIGIVIIIALAIGVILILSQFEFKELAVVQPSPDAQFIPNPDDPNATYTEILKASSFTCDADECIVIGSMKVEKGTEEGSKECCTWSKIGSCCMTDIDGKYKCANKEWCIDTRRTVYKANFNFCPEGVPNFPHCSGSTNTVSSPDPNQIYHTDEFLLNINQAVNFNPKYPDGEEIIERFIKIKKYDKSCVRAIERREACTSEQIWCAPQLVCPSGWVLRKPSSQWSRTNPNSRVRCSPPFRGGSAHTSGKPICWESTRFIDFTDPSNCQEPTFDYTKYKKCDATQQIGLSTCGAFSDTLYSASQGQECFLLNREGEITDNQGEGFGGLKCPGDPCALGSKRGITGNRDYEECTIVGNCNKYTLQFCPEGLVYNDEVKDCVFPPEKSCSAQQARCEGSDLIRYCRKMIIDNKEGWQWEDTASNCPGDMQCQDNEGDFDFCSCNPANECQLGEIECIDNKNYKECAKDSNDVNSCFTFRDFGAVVSDSDFCDIKDNKIKPKPGCENNPSECAEYEECVDNVCVCRTDVEGGYCSPMDSIECVGDFNYKKCEQIPGTNCWRWNPYSCAEYEECLEVPGGDDICVCKTTGEYCPPNAPSECVGEFNFRICEPLEGTLCWKWNPLPCPSETKCSGGQCFGFGCAFPGTGFDCVEENFEVCVDNQCLCIQDENTANELDYLNQKTRCKGNTIQEVKKYGNCYRWEDKLTCSQTEICTMNSPASCQPVYQYVGILSKDTYGIDELINGVVVDVLPTVGDNANIRVIAWLSENDVEILGTRKDKLTDNQGKATLDFNYGHPRSGTLKIEVIVGDPAGIFYQTSKEITIQSTLDLRLNCPVQGYTGKTIECSWKTYNVDTGKLMDITDLRIFVTQGGVDLDYTPVARTGVKFQTENTGSVLVKVTANKEGFISDTAESLITIERLGQVQIFEIDNVDYFSNNEISTGTHQLVLKITDSTGEPEQVKYIDAEVRTPSGQTLPLIFNKINEGEYKTTYNFQQAGTTYQVNGMIVFEDIKKDNIPFSYSIVTLESITEKEKTNIFLLIGLIGGGVILVIIVIFILLKRRK